MIDLKVVVFPALAPDARPDPVFVLAGGPGQGAAQLSSVLAEAFRRVRRQRDLVFVDQRGTGDSNGLRCEVDADDLALLMSPRYFIQTVRRCRERYDADLRLYTTPIAMDDLDEVRARLGYSTVNLWGGSYGTRAALVYLRRHGEHVRSAAFDSSVPLRMKLPLSFPEDGQRALDLMFDACEQEDPCRNRFPGLRVRFSAWLERQPMLATTKHPRTGVDVEFQLSSEFAAGLIQRWLYVPEMASMLPLLID